MRVNPPAALLGALCAFAALAQGGHDLWAATLIHLGALAAGLWLLAVCRKEGSKGVPLEPLLPALVLALAFAASTAGSVNPSESLLALRDALAALLLFWVSSRAMDSEEASRNFMACLALVCWVELGVILWQHYDTHFNTPIPKEVQHPGVPAWLLMLSYQVPGTLVNSNAAAAFLLLAFPVLGSRALRGIQGGRAGWFWTAGLAADVLSLLLLKSTWALLWLGAGALLLAGPGKVKEFLLKRPRLSAALSVLALAGAGGALAWKFLHVYNWAGEPMQAGETTRRFSWWAAGWAMFRDHPLLGVGAGNFPSAFLAYRPGPMQNTRFAHGFLVTLASETGLAGLCAAGFFVLWYLKRLLSHPRTIEERWPLLLGPALFLGFTSINLGVEYLANLMLLAVLLGAALAPEMPDGPRPGPMSLSFGAACALACVAFLLPPLQASRLCVRGGELLDQGDDEGALRVFSDAVSLDGLAWEAQAGAARALLLRYGRTRDLRDLREAAAHQRRAVELDRLDAPLRGGLSSMLEEIGSAEESPETRRKALPSD